MLAPSLYYGQSVNCGVVDWNDPITRNLEFGLCPELVHGQNVNLVGGETNVWESGTGVTAFHQGRLVYNPDNEALQKTLTSQGDGWSVLAISDLSETPATFATLATNFAATGNAQLIIWSGGNWSSLSGGAQKNLVPAAKIPTDPYMPFILTGNASGCNLLFANGVYGEHATAIADAPASWLAQPAFTRPFINTELVLGWTRKLSISEMEEIVTNPYRFLKPEYESVVLPFSSGLAGTGVVHSLAKHGGLAGHGGIAGIGGGLAA